MASIPDIEISLNDGDRKLITRLCDLLEGPKRSDIKLIIAEFEKRCGKKDLADAIRRYDKRCWHVDFVNQETAYGYWKADCEMLADLAVQLVKEIKA